MSILTAMAAVMLYKYGGKDDVWGHPMETKIVDDAEVKDHLKDGWSSHPLDAVDAEADRIEQEEAEEREAIILAEEERKRKEGEELLRQQELDAQREQDERERIQAENKGLKATQKKAKQEAADKASGEGSN